MRNLLLLEEDAEGRETLARVLRKRGFSVTKAKDQASALLQASSPLIDLVLAGATYYDRADFLSDLRERRPYLPVIFLNDYYGPESKLLGIRYGAFSMSRRLNCYINMRPIRLDELESMIRIALGRRYFDRDSRLAA